MRFAKWLAGALLLMVTWSTALLFGATEGWFRRPVAPPGDARAFMHEAVRSIEADGRANVALALIEEREVFDTYHSQGIGPDTLFPVASLGKWLTAYGVMTLAQAGKVDLDAPVDTYLKRWQLPTGEFDRAQVTTRRLLSHTAGLRDGLGFGEYAASETVPDLVASLEQPRASSGQPVAIRVGRKPGSEWDYSGGGYLVLELLVEEVSGQRFADYMAQAVFTPLGMTRSTYAFLGDQPDTAASLTADGAVAPFQRYAALGATGLATTENDLLRFVRAQLLPPADAPLPVDTVRRMRAPEAYLLDVPIWGLGTVLYAQTASGDAVFGHAGRNAPAINAEVRVNPDTGDALLVLVTGDPTLASRLGFLWTFWQTGRPDFLSFESEIERVLPWLGLGLLAVALAALAGFRRSRERSAPH